MISQSTLFNQYRSHEETTRLDTKMYETIQRMAMENNGLSSTSPSALLLRARRSGKCPVSLIHDISLHGTISYSGGFDEAVLRIIDDDVVNSASGGFGLRSDISVGKEFLNILKVSLTFDKVRLLVFCMSANLFLGHSRETSICRFLDILWLYIPKWKARFFFARLNTIS